jgi:hypothetical protein
MSTRKKSQQWLSCYAAIYALWAVVAVHCMSSIRGAERDPKEAPRAADVDRLMEALVTTNLPPERQEMPGGGFYKLKFSATFDWTEYARVVRTIKELERIAEDAWPQIVDHMLDKEYCVSTDRNGSGYNYSRGQVCYLLACNWLNRAYCGLMPLPPHYNFQGPAADPKELQKWCKERRDKPMSELQIEAGEWAIAVIPKESNESKEEQDFAIAAIREQIAKIRESKAPMPAKFFYPDTNCAYTEAESLKKDTSALESKK